MRSEVPGRHMRSALPKSLINHSRPSADCSTFPECRSECTNCCLCIHARAETTCRAPTTTSSIEGLQADTQDLLGLVYLQASCSSHSSKDTGTGLMQLQHYSSITETLALCSTTSSIMDVVAFSNADHADQQLRGRSAWQSSDNRRRGSCRHLACWR